MPVTVWREAMDVHFPGQAWLRLERGAYDRLAAYRGTWADRVGRSNRRVARGERGE